MWGETEVVLATPTCEVHRLSVLPHAQCSLHRHAARWNAFYVLEGEVTIEVVQRAYALTDETVLREGDSATVAPGLLHRFRTGESGARLLEVYYPAALGAEDIERTDAGKRNPS